MPPRRFRGNETDDNDSDDDNDISYRCLSCGQHYHEGMCKECFPKVSDKNDIQKLKAKVSLLELPSPILNPSKTDITLLPSDDPSADPIRAHKYILVSRSPVFKAMLDNDMTESRSGTIKISDVSYVTLCAFVNYLYTAEVSIDNNQMACDLLVSGEKYQVKQLKAHCEEHLIARLNFDKAIESYAFAYQYDCNQLLQASLEAIMDNMSSLTLNEFYTSLVDSNPRLVVDIYEQYLIKRINTAGKFLSKTKKILPEIMRT